MTMGERIRQRREELKLTQTDLANRMGYKSRAAICNIEKDKEDLTTARISKLAKALNTTPAYLMGWEESNLLDAEDFIETNKTKVSKNELEAMKLYSAYKNATPEIQAAVEILLKGQSPASSDSHPKSKTNG